MSRLRLVAGEGVGRAAIKLQQQAGCTVPRARVASPAAIVALATPRACCAAECAGA
ncbi:hypothetical protein FHY25_000893 [Xanthomonas arboricola]|nr:hypothetical protein [Xanthomonas campestris]MCW2006312.1 hypothetical protein [Xanthomonas campestris]CEM58434.1 hypothetical protein XCCB1459_2329 [Xanthomonas campestris pv. campestris]